MNLLFRMYHAGKVSLNYLIDRDVELDNLVLMDYYTRTSPRRWQGVKSLMKFTGEYAVLAQDIPRLPAMRLVGEDWSMVYVGRGQSLLMIKPTLFKGDVKIEDLGRVPVWKLPQMMEQWSREGAGLVIHETSRAYKPKTEAIGKLVFRVPAWVQQIVELPKPVESLIYQSGMERDYRRVLKRISTADITYSFSASQAEFDHFYHKLYRPFITARHGEYALVTPYEDLLRWFRRGGLILLHGRDDPRPLAGLVVYLAGEIAYAIEAGFVDNDRLWQRGLNPYLFWSFFRWAGSQGAEKADLGGSFPVRTHGVFIQKRRWGAQVALRKRITSSLECTAGQLSPALEDHLNQIGLITEFNGKNYGLVFNCHKPTPTKDEVSRMAKSAGQDGLAGVFIYYQDGSYQMIENE